MLKYVLVVTLFTCLGLSMTGCNTVHGMGQDTKQAGQGMENAADNNK